MYVYIYIYMLRCPLFARQRTTLYEQWLQRHPETGSSWPSWPKASRPANTTIKSFFTYLRTLVYLVIYDSG